jgi:predicted metal-binding protein
MDITSLLTFNIQKVKKSTIHFSEKPFRWCTLPYPNHPNGCPNYNKNPLCPPTTQILDNKLDSFNAFYLVYARFQLNEYVKEMMKRHPKWSYRQASCVLYWQGSVKRRIKTILKQIYRKNPNNQFYLFASGSGFKEILNNQEKIYSMEAAGIDVFKTLRNNDIEFEIKPKKFLLLVNLLCAARPLKFNQKE